MWKRNLLFALCCLVGVASLSGMLLRRDRIKDPRDFLPGRYAGPDYGAVIQQVNSEFRESWCAKQVQTSRPASDLAVARRLSLGLTGTVPSLEEIHVFEQHAPDERLEWWLSHLLEDRRWSDYSAERLARAYVGTDQGPFLLFRRRRFVTWLSDQLWANRPYDELVRALITAKGLWTDSPAVNFLTATAGGNEGNQPDDVKLAGRTARAFLGTRLDCLQCHDDKLGSVSLGTPQSPRDGLQSDFHQLAAFYSDASTSLLGIHDFATEYRFKYLGDDAEQVVKPMPPFLTEIVRRAPTHREQLAEWVTSPNNRPFARAIVNRIWALLFGKPLVDPIDAIPLYGPFPPGLDTLAQDLIDHHFDLRRLIRVIAATDVFRLDSRADYEITETHEAAWSVFPLSRLRPEQVAGGILQSASLTTVNDHSHILTQLIRFFQQRDFIERFGDIGEDEFGAYPSTITQRLLMMNGELVKERTGDNPITNAATRIAMLAPDDRKAIETAFLAVLTRRPVGHELAHFQRSLFGSPSEAKTDSKRKAGAEGSSRRIALEDLYWVLINSSEFSWNH